jgi:glycosyltransferase involved in cell wall biosynthesis
VIILKVCIIGDIEGNLDEGMKNVAYNLFNLINKFEIELIIINPKKIFHLGSLNQIRKFNPDIIHYIAGPTLMSFLITKIFKYFFGAKTIISVIHPRLLMSKRIISFLKPDLALIQSDKTGKLCEDLRFNKYFLPNGVDLDKFKPADQKRKDELRKKYNISTNSLVVLHVGNLRSGRNLLLLDQINDGKIETVIVSSTTIKGNKKVKKSLKKSGIKIFDNYCPNIEEFYNLSDCYLFPTFNENNCIEIPLSVLEAMACNIIVISTKFGGLSSLFQEGGGLKYVNSNEEIIHEIKNIQKNLSFQKVNTRDKILEYSWENIVIELLKIYKMILDENN